MTELSNFHSDLGFDIRFMNIDDVPYANGSDAAIALGFSNPARDIQNKVWKEYRFKFNADKTVGQPGWWLNEYGLNQLIFASNHPKAIEIQRWIFEKVLPSIRVKGGYISPIASDDQLTQLLADFRSTKKALVDANKTLKAMESFVDKFPKVDKPASVVDQVMSDFVRQRFQIDPVWDGVTPKNGFIKAYTGDQLIAFWTISTGVVPTTQSDRNYILHRFVRAALKINPAFLRKKVNWNDGLSTYRYFGLVLIDT